MKDGFLLPLQCFFFILLGFVDYVFRPLAAHEGGQSHHDMTRSFLDLLLLLLIYQFLLAKHSALTYFSDRTVCRCFKCAKKKSQASCKKQEVWLMCGG